MGIYIFDSSKMRKLLMIEKKEHTPRRSVQFILGRDPQINYLYHSTLEPTPPSRTST